MLIKTLNLLMITIIMLKYKFACERLEENSIPSSS